MPVETYHIKSFAELQDVYDAVNEDINQVDYAEWLMDELDRMADLHRSFFQNQAGPDGQSWPKNAPITVKRKGHTRILRGHPANNFRLSRSLSDRVRQTTGDAIREGIQESDGQTHLKFGTLVEYSDLHDVERQHIPARRHVGINEQHLTGMVERVADHIISELAK